MPTPDIHRTNKIKSLRIMFKRSVYAGVMIGFGCIINLACENPVAGALFFGVGLFFIEAYGGLLFTGACGQVSVKTPINRHPPWWCYRDKAFKLVLCLCGNLVGIAIIALLHAFTGDQGRMLRAFDIVCELDSQTIYSMIAGGLACGILMYVGTRAAYITGPIPDTERINVFLLSTISKFLAVACFVLCGFWHCIATWGYCLIALPIVHDINVSHLLFVLIIALANFLGARFARFLCNTFAPYYLLDPLS